MAKRRETNVFSLSFLDIMSCGFGAVILIFVVIQHGSVSTPQESNLEMMAEIKRIEKEVLDETKNLVQLKNTVQEQDDEIATTEEAIIAIIQLIVELEKRIVAAQSDGASNDESIEKLKSDLKELE
ncbi:MAG: septal ring factor EnvC (AmiA/AmiB activator), partial [Candidatus Azotimanducaceae bacterium]